MAEIQKTWPDREDDLSTASPDERLKSLYSVDTPPRELRNRIVQEAGAIYSGSTLCKDMFAISKMYANLYPRYKDEAATRLAGAFYSGVLASLDSVYLFFSDDQKRIIHWQPTIAPRRVGEV